ncbi:alcohol oxidase [Mycena galopus ATCC 62051]|nr:alcohol oxidase [Mycena galopus ATCC 62051]
MTVETFDYVVVGGGTAGLVVAARLVENPAIRVCVLEAGEDVTKNLDAMVPGFGFKNLGQPKVDWGFMGSPQVHAKGRSIYLPRGKSLGGTSMLNLMTLGRAHAAEYDAFETLGSPGWNWESLLPYFMKSETFAPSADEMSKMQVTFNPAAHGTSGPLQRTLPKWISDVQPPFIEGLAELGVSYNTDGTSGDNTGMWTSNHSIDNNGARSSSASAYYEPNKSKSNLVVITGARATRILLDGSLDASGHLVASGVEYSKDGQLHEVSAKAEVLVCAGAFQTPQLLELSGIGDKNILESHGVQVHLDLPGVGRNLQDHFWSPFVLETDSKYESAEVLTNPARAAEEWKLYEESRTGMLSGTCSTLFAFLPRDSFMADSSSHLHEAIQSLRHGGPIENTQKTWLGANDIPLLEVAIFPGFLPVPGYKGEEGKSYCSVFLALTHPLSSGTVHISSADPLTAPEIDHCVLDNEVDIQILVESLKFARKFANTESLKPVLIREIMPGPAVQTDEELKEFIRTTVDTVFHPVGTAAMLPKSDGGVVDPSLRVYGTSNIRVIDASIIPIQLSAHTQATVYAIAEKAADMIKHAPQK